MANKSAIFTQNTPGLPVNIVDNAKNPGSVYFVHSGTGTDGAGYGQNPDSPLATLDYFFGLATANKNDVCYILPGHSESYSTTGAKVTADKAGAKIVGLGTGSNRPTFTFSHTGATWTISAANIGISNCLFVTGVDSVVTFGTISGSDFKMIACEMRDTTDIEVISDWTITGDRPQILNCFKNGYTGGNANARVLSMNGVDGALVKDCRFSTKVTTGVINFVTGACSDIYIENCDFLVSATSDLSKNVVDTVTGSTFQIKGCFDSYAGYKFSGSDQAAAAGDDVSAVNTAVTAIQADLGDYSARTNLQSKLAVDGNPDVSGATTWSALINSNGTYSSKLGTKVTRAAADIFDGTTTALFTVATGRILLTHIELEVTTAAVDNTASNTRLVSNPTVGTDMNLCANLDVDSDESGSIYSITGTITDALQGGSGGGSHSLANPIVVPEGTIDLISSADAGTGGALVKCELWYIVLDSGATVTST